MICQNFKEKYITKTSLFFFIICFSFLFISKGWAQNSIGIFDNHEDIGKPKWKGNTLYDPNTQTYTLTGGGYNIWFNRDEFQYAYKKIKGDFILTANFEFTDTDDKKSNHRKMGWMIRESEDESAAGINACAHYDGLTVLQWRALRGAFMRDPEDEIFAPKKGGQILQLERKGDLIIMRIAHPGEPLQVIGTHRMKDMRDEVLAGIYVCSHDSNSTTSAKIWNVRMDFPVGSDEFNSNPSIKPEPDAGILGCRLELMDIQDGIRKVIYETKSRFEAPNWLPDGKRIVFNSRGNLYTIPIEGGDTTKINLGGVNHNNNDHTLSFDGKFLGISSHRPGLPGGGSTVYIAPIKGGEPRLITQETPSYLHGWSPNGKELLVIGQRGGSKIYNIYAVSVKDGHETALTHNTTGHVDGSEYSPDGKYIYYNANISGTMQIWRMKPDGSDKEPLTFDDNNNWFPHISPNGKWIAFVSFPNTIDPSSHPSYKRITLKLMPVSGGAPRVIAYLYGGQGTFNVNSWAPDSEHLAFVSNSGK